MRKKYIFIMFIILLLFFNNNVRADINVNSSLGSGESSVSCGGSICSSTIKGYYGISVKVCNKSNNNCTTGVKITNKNVKFKIPSTCDSISNGKGKLNFCWKEYFENLDSAELEKILKAINNTYTVKKLASENKYLIVTPLVGIRLYFNPSAWGFQTNTYFKGTINEVVAAMDSAGSYVKYKSGSTLSENDKKLATNYGQGFTRQAPGTCSGSLNSISCGWNVLRNYYTQFKLEKAIGPYKKKVKIENNYSSKYFKDNYNSSIYGKIAIDVSDYVHTVAYYSNKGSSAQSEKVVEGVYYPGDKFTLKSPEDIFASPGRDNYDFVGWKVKRYESKGTQHHLWYVTGVGWKNYNDSSYEQKKMYYDGQSFNLKGSWLYEGLNSAKVTHKGPYTYVFYAQWKKIVTPKLTIRKVFKGLDGKNKLILSSNATFNIYKGSTCSGTAFKKDVSTSNGKIVIKLDPGTYSIQETKAPTGYIKSNECETVTIGTENQTVNFVNEKDCDKEVEEIKKTYTNLSKDYKIALINLYSANLASGDDFRQLLDFKNPSCNIKTSCTSELNKGCLNAKKSKGDFGTDDLSCYEEMINKNNQTGFCKDSFRLTNSLNITDSTYTFKGISGQFLISKNENIISYFNENSQKISTNVPFLTAEMERICYFTGTSTYSVDLPSVNIRFGDNDSDGIADLLPKVITSNPRTQTTVGSLEEIKIVKNITYGLNKVNLEKFSGKVTNITNGTLAVEGIISPFNHKNGVIPFEVEIGNYTDLGLDDENSGETEDVEAGEDVNASEEEEIIEEIIDDSTPQIEEDTNIEDLEDYQDEEELEVSYETEELASGVCNFMNEPEVIRYEKEPTRGQLQIEFRVIDTHNPFERSTNSNWCDSKAEEFDKCKANNSVVTKKIINAPNSYGQNAETPKYKITLNSSDIKVIREYNIENKYDSYNAYCEDDTCYNSFVEGLKLGKIFSINDDNSITEKNNLTSPLILYESEEPLEEEPEEEYESNASNTSRTAKSIISSTGKGFGWYTITTKTDYKIDNCYLVKDDQKTIINATSWYTCSIDLKKYATLSGANKSASFYYTLGITDKNNNIYENCIKISVKTNGFGTNTRTVSHVSNSYCS